MSRLHDNRKKDPVFEPYKDLSELTSKTLDEHVEFYKTRKTKTDEELLEIYKKLSVQSEKFDKLDWIDTWHNRDISKHWHVFQNCCNEARFFIENYLRVVLEEMLIRKN